MAAAPQKLSDLSRLLQAKAIAVARFLSRREPVADLSEYIISSKPQHNVVGIGIGSKITKGIESNISCLRFYVDHKLPRQIVPEEFLLPSDIEDVVTDVIETGR